MKTRGLNYSCLFNKNNKIYLKTRFNIVRFIIFLCLAQFVFIGCPPKVVVRKPVSIDGVMPLDLIKKNNQNAAKLRSVQAIGRFTLESPKTANRASVQLAVAGKDSVYIKLEGFLGIDGLKAVFNRKNFLVYNIIKKLSDQGVTIHEILKDICFDGLSFIFRKRIC